MADKTVFMFPGQGSQYVGMRKPLGEYSDRQREYFSVADEILGVSLSGIMDCGSEQELTRTSNAQPALLAMAAAYLDRALELGQVPEIVMGHSLGEYAALFAAGSISYEDGIRIVRRRGELMERASDAAPGGMAAVIGASRDILEEVVSRCRTAGVLEIANDNAPGQLVLSGENAAIDAAASIIGEEKIGRAVRLNVSAPFHSSLMRPMTEEFAAFLDSYSLKTPQVQFIDNVTGKPETEPGEIRKKLVRQLFSPVLWSQSVQTAYDAGGRVFVECGPGSVLAGLVKRIVKGVSIIVGEKMQPAG